MRARVVAYLLQLATVDLTLRRYRNAGQCSGLQAGGEGPRGRAARPERALDLVVVDSFGHAYHPPVTYVRAWYGPGMTTGIERATRTLRIPMDLHRWLKVHCAEQGRTGDDVVTQAIREYRARVEAERR